MWKNRLGYGLLMALLAVLLFLFSKPFLLGALVIAALLALAMFALLRRDASVLHVAVQSRPGGREGTPLPFSITVSARRPLLVTRCVLVELELKNAMFGTVEQRKLLLELSGGENRFDVPFTPEQCGQLRIHCAAMQVRDLLDLFEAAVAPFRDRSTTIYPRRMSVRMELSRETVGATRDDGLMQNRKGSDPSEMFDIREYVPGDDVRAIHWKLSGKTDSLIMRQPSDPSHYNVALLPDLGFAQDGVPTSAQELNAAAALVSEVGEQLLKLGVAFCMAIPTGKGLQLREVRDERDLERILPEWLGLRVSQSSGDGLKYFLTDHLEEHFTRLIVISAGKYALGVDGLGRRGGTLVISAVTDTDVVRADSSGGCEIIELPAEQRADQVYCILC